MITSSWGDGATSVVVLPSNGMSAACYERLGRALAARGCTTTAVTLPGFDGTPPLPRPSWEALLDAVEPLARSADVLVGHSMGGMLAAQLAARLPVRRLVLLEPAITPIPALGGVLARAYRRGAIDDGREGFVNAGPGFRRLHAPERYPADLMELATRCDRTTDRATLHALADGFPGLRVPWDRIGADATLVRGASSGWLMLAAQLLLARRLRARRVTLANAGHWMVGEVDEELADVVSGGREP